MGMSIKLRFLEVFVLGALSAKSQQLPSVKVADSRTGKVVPFNSVVKRGRVSLITFWGTWCTHGKHQVKTIAAKLPEWHKHVDFDFVAIAEDQVGTEGLVSKYVAINNWSFPCYTDAAAGLKPSLGFFALPYTIVVDRNGKVVYKYTGYENGGMLLRAIEAAAK